VSKPYIVNKAWMAQAVGVSLKTVDDWVRRGAPVLKRGTNGVSYQIDAAAFLQWVRAYRQGITIAELRRRDLELDRRLRENYP
jgi:terminase small subunit / prophage DNA-packing protein